MIMKKLNKKLPLLATLVLLLIMSCSKTEEITPVEPSATYTLVSNETSPGEVVEIKVNKTMTNSEIEVLLNDKKIKAYSNGEYSYVFITPVLDSGNYNLKFSVANSNVALNLMVRNYVAITNPENVISDFVVNRDKCFDIIKKAGTSLETLMMIEQIKEEWNFQYSKNTIADKLLLAYVVQKNPINPDWFNTSSKYPDNYYNKSNAVTVDAGEKLVTTAKEFVTAQTICLASIPALVGTGTLFLSAPNFVTGAVFVATFTVFVVSREVAIQKAKDVGSLKGVAEAVADVSYQKIAALEFLKDTDTDISMKINFRNLKSTDVNIQTDITKAFNEEKKFTEEDSRVKTLYDKTIKFTEKLKGLYVNYVSLIGKTSERNITLTVLDKDIIVQGSSNADIKVSTTLNGDVRKIKANSASTIDLNFNLKIAYKRSIDDKEIVKEIPSVLKSKLAIGMLYQGGVIGYIMQLGDPGYIVGEVHGLIIASSDQSIGNKWMGIYSNSVTEWVIGSGNQNTINIVNHSNSATSAAAICYNLVLNGYSDWYLPSRKELEQIYFNRTILGGFGGGIYWTSSGQSSGFGTAAIDNKYAYCVNFSNGTPYQSYSELVTYTYRVRAFRSF